MHVQQQPGPAIENMTLVGLPQPPTKVPAVVSVTSDNDNSDRASSPDSDFGNYGFAAAPLEVLHQILSYLSISDIPSLSLSCRHIRDFIQKNELLWKALYVKQFDEAKEKPLSWQSTVKRLMVMRKLLISDDLHAKLSEFESVSNTAIDMLIKTTSTNPERNIAFLVPLFSSRQNKTAFLSRSSLFRLCGMPLVSEERTEELRQLSAKLQVYYGADIDLTESDLETAGAKDVHPFARSRVYDLRRYKDSNGWGPFMDDGSGRVDWEKVQAISLVLGHGIRLCSERSISLVGTVWDRAFEGVTGGSYESMTMEISSEMEKDTNDEFAGQDPYGVRGTWMRVVNFLDYHDLFGYNFHSPDIPADQERPPIATKEAIRLIVICLWVVQVEQPNEDSAENDPSMPVVHFEGSSRSLTNRWDPNANSRIRGHVRMTRHGDIRWTTFSVFDGEERWRSESIQVGGIRSARGTLGNWFEKNYDRHGPAGPTAFWKISDEIVCSRRPRNTTVTIHDLNDEDDDDDDEETSDEELTT